MSEKKKGKKNIANVLKRNRERFLKPLITEEDFKDDSDVFLSAVKNRSKTEKHSHLEKHSYFLSPMRGKVVDRSTFPVTSSKGKIDKQYDFIRTSKRIQKEELKTKLGHEYYEFNVINNRIKAERLKRSHTVKNINSVEQEDVESAVINETKPVFKSEVDTKLNIIYEEEIEIDEDKNIITSYDDESNPAFFTEYEELKLNQNYNSNIHIYEHEDKNKGLKAELKKIFADEDYSPNNNVYYEDKFSYEPEPYDFKEKQSEKKVDFVNLKRELDQKLQESVKETPKTKPLYDLAYYQIPPLDLLKPPENFYSDDHEWIENQMAILDSTFDSFGIAAKAVGYTQGPSVTRYEIEPEPGTKVSRITALQDDIKLRLAASDIRIEAPISGKSSVGIEVPNREKRMVTLREIISSNAYKMFKSPLKIALGLDIAGEPIFSDISSMTHSLIAGSTGSGKSVCINCIIISILYNSLPDEVKLVLIDPKKVEFSMYRDIPHLLTPVINDPKVATATLKWLSEEMDRRYELIESVGARDIKSYNTKRNRGITNTPKLPYIVVIIDELADLMVIAANEVEEYIQRISQLARAAGIHLIVATQRPSTNVITGTIKTNIPTRISFKVASAIDSRIILDESGAEKLLGKGDMLLSDNGKPQLMRLQGSFITEDEIDRVTAFVKDQYTPDYEFTAEDLIKKENELSIDYDDELFDDAVRYVIEIGEASASKIQRRFKVGYNRAARIIDLMEEYNIVGPQQGGAKPRDVLMTIDEYEKLI
jgi:S-DNA-T family DNA segregation ATPase FtsK/SpoIIIE